MAIITMKNKRINKFFNDAFEQFILEHCELKNLRENTIRHYRQFMKYSFLNIIIMK